MQKLIETLSTVSIGQALAGGVTVVALVSVFIEITPVKINPVSKFLAWLGRKINSEVIAKVDRLETEVQAMRKADGGHKLPLPDPTVRGRSKTRHPAQSGTF